MSKKDLIDTVAKELDMTKEKAGQVVDAVIDGIKGALKDGEEVVEPIVDRILGRVTAEDVWDRRSGQVLIDEGHDVSHLPKILAPFQMIVCILEIHCDAPRLWS